MRIRESEKFKTVLELYDLEILQKKIGPVYSSIFEIRIFAPEMKIMKETPWSRIQGQSSVDKEFLETFANGSPTGSVLMETMDKALL